MKVWRRGFKSIFAKNNPDDKQWVKDFYLEELDIFYEYLEMVLQYGFVTIFVSAFPLAPLCALINNLFESRIDAQKFLISYRRPVAVRVKGIGVWLTILDFVSKFAVFSNALIIAFTSEFIPHLVYRLTASPDWSLKGYTNYSLSYMNVAELDRLEITPLDSNVTICRYKDYRYPPWHENKYHFTTTYWTVLAARLIFMVLFENVVIFLVLIISWAIPDVPVKLKEKIRRETYIVNNIIIQQARDSNKRQDETKSNWHHASKPTIVSRETETRHRSPKTKKLVPYGSAKIDKSVLPVTSDPALHVQDEKKLKKDKKKGLTSRNDVPGSPGLPRTKEIKGVTFSSPDTRPNIGEEDRPKKKKKERSFSPAPNLDQEEPPEREKKEPKIKTQSSDSLLSLDPKEHRKKKRVKNKPKIKTQSSDSFSSLDEPPKKKKK